MTFSFSRWALGAAALLFGLSGQAAWAQGLYVQADAMFLQRTVPDTVFSIIDADDPTPGIALSADALEGDAEAGLRLTIGSWVDCDSAVEVTYFGLHEWSESASATNVDENLQPTNFLAALVIGLAPVDDFTDAFQHTATTESELHNVEINLRRRLTPCGSFLFGFRYLNIDESFELLSLDENLLGADVGDLDVAVSNDLLGLQIGGDLNYATNSHFSWGLRGKAGLFVNIVDTDFSVINNGAVLIAGGESDESLASLVETAVLARYCFNENLALRASYDVIMLGGVGVASETQPFENETTWAIYHGPSVGVEWTR